MALVEPVREIAITSEVIIGGTRPFVLIAGPCVLETEKVVMETAERLKDITTRLGIPWIFKASFWKDNRSRVEFYRGPGLEEGLRMLEKVRNTFEVPVLTDIHLPEQAAPAAEVVDVLQIPAFLSMQTSLAEAAARTGKPINVKKGQFLAPEDAGNILAKYRSLGNDRIMLTERGVAFGYHNLVVDFRSIPIMRKLGHPVILDASHPVRRYGVPSKDPRGGAPEFIPYIARAGAAVGVDGIFMEMHPNPPEALSDASSMLPLDQAEGLLKQLVDLDRYVKEG